MTGTDGGNIIRHSGGGNIVYGLGANDTFMLDDGNTSYRKSISGKDVVIYVDQYSSATLKGAATLALNIAGRESNHIHNTLANQMIITDDGDDTILNGQNKAGLWNFVTIDAGEGSDSITNNNASDVTIDAGAGNDTISNHGANSLIDGGDDDDTISNDGANSSINGGDDDTISNDGANSLIDGAATTTTQFPTTARTRQSTAAQATTISQTATKARPSRLTAATATTISQTATKARPSRLTAATATTQFPTTARIR